MTPTAWDVVVVGGANTGFLVRGLRLPESGDTVVGDVFQEAAGGKGANQAVVAARLGGRVAFVGRVRVDRPAQPLDELLALAGGVGGERERELVAAPVRRHDAPAGVVPDRPGRQLDDLVAGEVPVAVVDPLEPVEIKDRQVDVLTAELLQAPPDEAGEAVAVDELGHLVVVGQVAKPGRGPRPFDREGRVRDELPEARVAEVGLSEQAGRLVDPGDQSERRVRPGQGQCDRVAHPELPVVERRVGRRRLEDGSAAVVVGDGTLGLSEHAPYDAVVVVAAAPEVAPPLVAQLAEGGRLVQPIGPSGDEIVVAFVKRSGRLVEEAALTPAHFVPLRGRHGVQR